MYITDDFRYRLIKKKKVEVKKQFKNNREILAHQ